MALVPLQAFAAPGEAGAGLGAGSSSLAAFLREHLVLEEGESLVTASSNPRLLGLNPADARKTTGEPSAQMEDLPQKFDLRSEEDTGIPGGAVTSVKFQNPWNTCWAFSVTAATESNAIVQGLETASSADFSERHLAWFSVTLPSAESLVKLGAAGQEGEGAPTDGTGNEVLNAGGGTWTAAQAYVTGQGVAREETLPYAPADAGLLEDYDGDGNLVYSAYTEDGSWAVTDESLRTESVYQLENALLLRSPAVYETNEYGMPVSYEYDPAGTEEAKRALMQYGALDLGFSADVAEPDDETGDTENFSTTYWSQYIAKPTVVNHAVTVVGWDDTFPKEHFSTEPPADGAWIVKNSWGYEDGGPGGTTDWGIDGSGYFYLSYYDQSIYSFIAYEVADAAETYDIALQYDMLGLNSAVSAIYFDEPIRTANVFTAAEDMELDAASVVTSTADADVKLQVYLLDGDAQSPEDGVLALEQDVAPESAGYHRVRLSEPVTLRAGQRFAIVEAISETYIDEGGTQVTVWEMPIECGLDEECADSLGLTGDYLAVANEGESYVNADGVWGDATELNENDGLTEGGQITYGNAQIKAFGNPAELDDDTEDDGDDKVDDGTGDEGSGSETDDGADDDGDDATPPGATDPDDGSGDGSGGNTGGDGSTGSGDAGRGSDLPGTGDVAPVVPIVGCVLGAMASFGAAAVLLRRR